MKIPFKDFKKGEVKIEVTSLNDLWYLSTIIEQGDLVAGKTFRKIKLGGEDDRSSKIVKKPVYLSIEVEKIEFHKFSNSLRVSGKIVEGTDDVPKGSYHTFDLNLGSKIRIEKEQWLNYQKQKLEEATKEKLSKILIVVMDRSEATFALLKQYGYDILLNLSGNVQKKDIDEKIKSNFYLDISKQIDEFVKRHSIEKIIIASSAFWKEYLLDTIKKNYSELVSKINLATCNNTGKNGIDEVLKRNEVKTILMEDKAAREIILVEELLQEISKGDKAVYGLDETKQAAVVGAVLKLLVADDLITKMREEETYEKLDNIMKMVDLTNGGVFIISTDHEGGKKLSGIGGIGAILRYKLNY